MKLFSPLGLPGAIAAGATLLAMLLAQPASSPESGRWVRALSSGASSASLPLGDRAMSSLSLVTDRASADYIGAANQRPTREEERHP